jgi:cytoskeletal protein RodZ
MQSGANSRQPPWQSDGPEGDAPSFGTWLRRQREIREIPLSEIADVTKISIRYLEALEQDRFDVLPAPVFAKGFLKEYARFVGLDPDEVINSYLTTQQEAGEAEEEEARAGEHSASSSSILMGAGVIVLLALVGGLIYYSERFRGQERQAPPPIAAPPVRAVPPAPVPQLPEVAEPSTPLVVTMDFTEDCWVEAEVDGERRLSELHVQGESLRIEADDRVVLTLGNPGGVRIEANGVPFDPQVRTDRVARDIVIAVEAEPGPDSEGGSSSGSMAAEGRS